MTEGNQNGNLHSSRLSLDENHWRPRPLALSYRGLRSVFNLTEDGNIGFWLKLLNRFVDAELLGGFRRHQSSVVPRELRNGIRGLLKPAVVDVAAIPDRGICEEVDFDTLPGRPAHARCRILGVVCINSLVRATLEISVLKSFFPCHVAIIVGIFWKGKCLPHLSEGRRWFPAHSLPSNQSGRHDRLF